jgi:hypothetical protein
MAMRAFLRCVRLDPDAQRRAGVACTASLATDRPKRGAHRAQLAVQTAQWTAVYYVEFLKDHHRSRGEEEHLVSRLVLRATADACGVAQQSPLDLLGGEQLIEARMTAPETWRDLLLGKTEALRQRGIEKSAAGQETVPRAVFPGAFHPLHAGHRRMLQIAGKILAAPVEVEISILNVDKPPLDYLEIARRLEQFAAEQPIWLTRSATFEEKSRLFPGTTFVVGTDTLRRIADPRYYGGDASACRAAVERIAARGCRFLVFGRVEQGRIVDLADLELPRTLKSISTFVPETTFREDVSSSELRRQGIQAEPDSLL